MTAKTLYLNGILDKETCEDFYKQFKEIANSEEAILIQISLHQVTAVKSEGMIFLTSILKKVKQTQGKMCFIEAKPKVHDQILLSGLLYNVPFFSSPAYAQRFLST
ncbi:MAG: STAS domain-containing protein [SAR324 cluster bacterium]|nr:STAS domain-containing protein [SAR324 cluster bacterium]